MARQSQGFSIIEFVIILAVVLAAGLGGWYVWHKNQKSEPAKKSSSSTQTDGKKTNQHNQPTPDPYEGWKTYSNAQYGISFKYPEEWKITEVEGTDESSSPSSSTTTRFTVNVARSEEVKYNNTFAIEVLNQNLEEATKSYDEYFGQAPSNPATKTTNQLKGRQSVQYAFPETEAREKYYLFAVGGKSYLFRSINEELNLQTDSNYWTKFGKAFDSLEINP